ncbi:MAG: HlyD family efflux transporter periplasmic adaptor subunit [Methylococcales bacterium]|nr:HlyD family efflux transporter periplasmic adaptor subunit [Methylococcales bacterium]
MVDASKLHSTDPTRLVTRLHLLLVGLVVAAWVWMSIAELDVVSVAEGEVIPSSNVKYIQHLEGGIVRAILVKEGEQVEKGQHLFELEATATRADFEEKKQEILMIKARIASLRPAVDMIAEQVKISNGLMEEELTNRYNHLTLLREEKGLKGQLKEDLAALKGAEAAISKLQDSLDRTTLSSPVKGIIKKLNVYTIGGVVKAGDVLAEVVPGDDVLLVEARLLPQDVGYIETGQVAQVRLQSSDSMRLGKIMGEVIFISPDTLVPKEGDPYYRVRVQTDRSYFENDGERYHLLPGMQLTTSIITGKRTVLDYLISPFIESVDTSLRER